jgi:nitroreductase
MERMPNPVFDAVRTVLAVRDFDNRALPEGLLDRIAESAHLTASDHERSRLMSAISQAFSEGDPPRQRDV